MTDASLPPAAARPRQKRAEAHRRFERRRVIVLTALATLLVDGTSPATPGFPFARDQ
jgi:hypothetical protein